MKEEQGWKAIREEEEHGFPPYYLYYPRQECPNCGRYELRVKKEAQKETEEGYLLKLFGKELFQFEKTSYPKEDWYYWATCQHCDYKTEKQEEKPEIVRSEEE